MQACSLLYNGSSSGSRWKRINLPEGAQYMSGEKPVERSVTTPCSSGSRLSRLTCVSSLPDCTSIPLEKMKIAGKQTVANNVTAMAHIACCLATNCFVKAKHRICKRKRATICGVSTFIVSKTPQPPLVSPSPLVMTCHSYRPLELIQTLSDLHQRTLLAHALVLVSYPVYLQIFQLSVSANIWAILDTFKIFAWDLLGIHVIIKLTNQASDALQDVIDIVNSKSDFTEDPLCESLKPGQRVSAHAVRKLIISTRNSKPRFYRGKKGHCSLNLVAPRISLSSFVVGDTLDASSALSHSLQEWVWCPSFVHLKSARLAGSKQHMYYFRIISQGQKQEKDGQLPSSRRCLRQFCF